MIEKWNLFATSTLASSITNSATSLTVASGTGSLFPSSGNFRLLVDSEYMLGTGRSGDVISVQRAQEGSTAVSHASGATVSNILTAESLRQMMKDTRLKDPGSFTATAGGRISQHSDSIFLKQDDGSTVRAYGPIWKLVEPLASNFGWVNQGTGAVHANNGGLFISEGTPGTSHNLRIQKQAAPSTPYTITTLGIPNWGSVHAVIAGIGFRESSTGKLSTIHFLTYNSGQIGALEVSNWNSPTSFSSSPVFFDLKSCGYFDGVFLRITDDGTNVYREFSSNGFDFYPLHSSSRTAFMSSGPNEVFFFISTATTVTTYQYGYHLLSWAIT